MKRAFGAILAIALVVASIAAPAAAQNETVPVSGFSYQTDSWDYESHFGGNVFHQDFTAQMRMYGHPMLQGWMESNVHTVENYGTGTSNVAHHHIAFTLLVDAYPDSGWVGTGIVKGTVTPGTYHPFVDEGSVVAKGFGAFEGMHLRLDTYRATSTFGRTDYEGELSIPGSG